MDLPDKYRSIFMQLSVAIMDEDQKQVDYLVQCITDFCGPDSAENLKKIAAKAVMEANGKT